jgi:hypothetical protein
MLQAGPLGWRLGDVRSSEWSACVTGADAASRSVTAVLSAFCLATVCWIAWAWLTPGDYFANGNRLLLPSLISSGIIGFSVGWSAYGRGRLLILLLSTQASVIGPLFPLAGGRTRFIRSTPPDPEFDFERPEVVIAARRKLLQQQKEENPPDPMQGEPEAT